MREVLADHRSAPLPEAERALFSLVERVNQDPSAVRAEDLERARAAGWSDEALYDALTVCALFRFYNTWIDATGVADLPAAAYEASGRRLADGGYA
ncbi:MAG: peroxidase [Planctomycetota bacterium]